MNTIPPKIDGIDLHHKKAVLFAPTGEMIWFSRGWDRDTPPSKAVAPTGLAYLEYVDDPGTFLAYLADAATTRHEYSFMNPATGEMKRAVCEKIRYGDSWLVFYSCQTIPMMPAPPCLADFGGGGERKPEP